MKRMSKKAVVGAFAAMCLGIAGWALAQPATPEQRAGTNNDPNYGTLHLRTKLGSYKLMNGAGRVDIRFVGSMLISGLEGTVVVDPAAGPVKEEYKNDKFQKQVFSGAGRVTVTGKFKAIQWFGKDMDTVWYGVGQARIDGEFDRNLETGFYWYDDPAEKFAWPSDGTMTITNPAPNRRRSTVTPREVAPQGR